MVYDYLENSSLYRGLSEGIALGLQTLATTDLMSLEPGDYPIIENKLVLKIQCYNSKPAEEVRLEAHQEFIDIQYIVSGEEKIAIDDLRHAGTQIEAHPESDIWFYEGQGSEVLMRPGQFMIIYPGEAHAPCIAVNSPAAVRKALIKVSTNYKSIPTK